MKIARIDTTAVTVPLDEPIGSALGQIRGFGCILVRVRGDTGVVGENLIFTLNDRRTKVLVQMVEELGELLIGRDAGHIAEFWARAWKDINFLGHKGVPVVGISALDGALWDALGKTAGLPLYVSSAALGRAFPRTIAAACGSHIQWTSSSPRRNASLPPASRP